MLKKFPGHKPAGVKKFLEKLIWVLRSWEYEGPRNDVTAKHFFINFQKEKLKL